MSVCTHCGESAEDDVCPRCAMLIPHIIGDHESLRPDIGTSAVVNAALESARGEPAVERWRALLGVLVLKQSAKVLDEAEQPKVWNGYSRSLWVAARQWHHEHEWELWDENPPELPNEFETPSGGRLTKARVCWALNGNRLPGPIPMADLADMLGSDDEEAAAAFEDWDEMLRALAACCWRIDEEPSVSWVSRRSEPLVPLPARLSNDPDDWEAEAMLEELHNHGYHPFWHWAEAVSEQEVMAQLMQCHIPQEIWGELSDNLGSVTATWKAATDEGWPELHSQSSCPMLMVMDDRLHLLVRAPNGFTLEPVPPDPAVWRFLIITALHPPNTPEGKLLRAIAWHWDMPTGEIQPDIPQQKALGFLHSVWWTSQKDFKLVEPDSVLIQGDSGLAYRLRLSGRPGNADFRVWAYPDMECARKDRLKMYLCIQVFECKGPLPLGDRLASYMLALREDSKSASDISTLEMLFNQWSNYQKQDRANWEMMMALRPQGFVEGPDEEDDWPDEDIEDYDLLDHDPQHDLTPIDLVIQHNTELPTATDSSEEPEGNVPDDVWQAIADAHGERMSG